MYAVVDIAGQQFKVEKGKKVFVHRLPGEPGSMVSLEKVLLIANNDKVNIGDPYIQKAVVTAQILSHLRGDTIQVFKKKKRKGYQLLNGHRQHLTEILIEEISESGLTRKAEPKKETETIKEAETSQESTKKKAAPVKDTAKAKTEEKKTDKPAAVKTQRVAKAVKKETGKPKTATVPSKAKVVKKTDAKAASPTADKAKKSGSKTASRPAEGKSKPVAKKTTEKKPADKKNNPI